MKYQEAGFGGSCHWCTEAIFQSLKGVKEVKQGWIASADAPSRFSEAVLLSFDPEAISLKTLIAVHLHTHSSTSDHTLREKYRSAVYTFNNAQQALATSTVQDLQKDFPAPILTEVVAFGSFQLNKPAYLNYYFTDPQKPFCRNIVNPKMLQLLKQFSLEAETEKLRHLLQ
jgi:peptide-methionine (S)-S-oxide reductase